MSKRIGESDESYKARIREYNKNRPRKSQNNWEGVTGNCATCKAVFPLTSKIQLGVIRKGGLVYCCKKCRDKSDSTRKPKEPNRGPCPTCGNMFSSYSTTKIYCNHKCYFKSAEFKERIESMKRTAECLNCKKEFRHKTRMYCCDQCRREYYASRFDRWVANPREIGDLQCFDEFLMQDELPCLIDGCDWRGKNLGTHVNRIHGVPVETFKEMVGFNRKTGLVTADLSKVLSEKAIKQCSEGNLTPFTPGNNKTNTPRPYYPPELRKEAREHAKKAQAIVRLTADPVIGFCRQCQQQIDAGWNGGRVYCNNECRNEWYRENKLFPMQCSHCGSDFDGDWAQRSRVNKGEKVCCSDACRNEMNMATCLASVGRKAPPMPILEAMMSNPHSQSPDPATIAPHDQGE